MLRKTQHLLFLCLFFSHDCYSTVHQYAYANPLKAYSFLGNPYYANPLKAYSFLGNPYYANAFVASALISLSLKRAVVNATAS